MAKGKVGAVLDGLKTGHLRWGILLLLFLSTILNYLDRQIFSVLAPNIKGALQLTDSGYALIINLFNLGTILGLLFAGPFMDRFGSRIGFTIAILVWSVAGGATALAPSLFAIAACRFFLGLGESGNWPAASKAVAEWFPAKERALAMGFYNGGVSIGAILAPFAVPFVILLTGHWRWVFAVSGLLSLPWVYFWWKSYHAPSRHPRVSAEELELINRDKIKAPARRSFAVLKTKAFWGLFAARMITSPVWFFISYWIFNYLNREFGFNLATMAAVAWIPFATSDLGNILGGYLSGKLIALGKRPMSARKTLMGLGAVLMTANGFAAFAHNAVLAIALISLLTLAWGIWVSNMLGLVSDSFPSSEVATVMSWTGLGQYAGSVVFTWFIGYALDNFGMGYVPVFLTAAALPILGFLFTLTLNKEKTAGA
ncbi:MAG: MFS transporter [Acidobacteriota bacterium]|nr:MFS transporter [Acidobacteriota bacterium]